MEGVTDPPARLWYQWLMQPDFCVSPFLRANGQRLKPQLLKRKMPELFSHHQNSFYPQIMANTPEDFLRAAQSILERHPFVEINCGCPAPLAYGSGAGSALLQNAKSFGAHIKTIVKSLGPRRLGVKMRLGVENPDEFSTLFGEISSLPLHHLTVHGRTKAQRYTGKADWQRLLNAATQTSFPVIASGDIFCLESFKNKHQGSRDVTSVLIGRGALRNPWVFHSLRREPSELTSQGLIDAIRLFAYLHATYDQSPEVFFDLYHINYRGSAEIYSHLQRCGIHPEESRFATARTKQLWHYLRSSCQLFMPELMRSKSVEHLLNSLRANHHRLALPPRPDPQYHWLYAGEKKPVLSNACQSSEISLEP